MPRDAAATAGAAADAEHGDSSAPRLPDDARWLRFATFELDLTTDELFKGGRKVHLPAQPARLLRLLAAHSGELVSREEIRLWLWGEDTFVDYEQGINVGIRQIRQALGDDATSPRFVETVPRKGYRFLAPVAVERAAGSPAGPTQAPRPPSRGTAEPSAGAAGRDADGEADDGSVGGSHGTPWRRWTVPGGILAAALALVLLLAWWVAGDSPVQPATGEDPARGAAAAEGPLVLVLPFDYFGEEAAGRHLADGLTEELITELARRYGGGLGVIARTTAMSFRGSDRTVSEIASPLGVEYVVEGSVRATEERVRVTAQLIRAGDEVHLWAGNYDRPASDPLALQTEVTEAIARALALALGVVPPEGSGDAAQTTDRAWAAYLEGRHDLGEGRLDSAEEAFRRALGADPGFAKAYLGLGQVHRRRVPPGAWTPAAREALEHALALDESLAEAHLELGSVRLYRDWHLEGARRSWERALEIAPAYAEAHHALAAYWSITGRHGEALAAVERARRLDPRSPAVLSDLGWYAYFAGRPRQAAERCAETLAAFPGHYWSRQCLWLAALEAGDGEAARDRLARELEHLGVAAGEIEALASGEAAVAVERLLGRALEALDEAPATTWVPPGRRAVLAMALGDEERALDELEQAAAERSSWILPFLGVYPLFQPLADEPRFRALRRRIGVALPAIDEPTPEPTPLAPGR